MRLETDAHYAANTTVNSWAIASRLPRALRQAIRLGWQADRPAVITLVLCQTAAAALTAFALRATASVLTAFLGTGTAAERLTASAPALIAVTVAASARYLLDGSARMAAARLAPQVTREADLAVILGSTAAELEAYEDSHFEDARAAASTGAERTRDLILDAQALTSAAAQLVAAAAIVSVLHPILLPLLLLAVVPRGWGAVRGARIEHAAAHRNLSDTRLRSVLNSYTTDRNTAAEVRAGTMAEFLLAQYRAVSRRLENEQVQAARRALVVQGTGDALAAVGTAATWAVLVYLVSAGRMNVALAGTAVIAVRASGAALTSSVRAGAKLFATSLFLDDWSRFLEQAQAWSRKRGRVRIADGGPQVISARGLSFTYPGAAEPALSDVDLDIKQGEVIAVVGENGSGKTTLSRLLTGLYLPTAGTVAWDGVDLALADPDSVWRLVALVPQDYTRWPMAARENITLGQPHEDGEAAVMTAARAAGADTVLENLPDGLDTSLARSWWGGHDLSGGQWQRIAIARAFHRNAPVLVMDEPTAALDARGEQKVFSRLKNLSQFSELPEQREAEASGTQHAHQHKGRITVFITHRMASTRIADRIIVMDKGRVVEDGTHDELMLAGGLFAELYKIQIEGPQK